MNESDTTPENQPPNEIADEMDQLDDIATEDPTGQSAYVMDESDPKHEKDHDDNNDDDDV